jgi:hypothetical protein
MALRMKPDTTTLFNDLLPHALSRSAGIIRPPTPKKPFEMPDQFIDSEEE